MTPHEFIEKWRPVALTERAAAHTHFLDLCKVLEHDDPVSADPRGEWFTFEKGATKSSGGEGFADVWKKGFFAWEYKKKKRDLDEAIDQLVRYAAALENPPLQIACDTDRFVVRTAWTNAVPKIYEFSLDDLAEPQNLAVLRAAFHDPERLKPKETRAGVTREAADKFSTIALRLQGKGSAEEVAHFVNQLVFCFFANSVKLLPKGFFERLLRRTSEDPSRSKHYFDQLFTAMEKGGEFDLTPIAHFNGGLFDGRRALPLGSDEIALLIDAVSLDWGLIDPSIFGTLFERFLDPEKRGQIGAHYTDPEKIMMILEPVVLRPLRQEWDISRKEIETILVEAEEKRPKIHSRDSRRALEAAMARPRAKAEAIRSVFLERLKNLRVLDPACGSGNFLYLALQEIKDIENKANLECEALGLPPRVNIIGPEILYGIEINEVAAELARTVIWIGDIQWRRQNGIYHEPPPILRKLDNIECRDALVTKKADGTYEEAKWPEAEFIVGNPPFLGSKFFRKGRPAKKGRSATKGLGDEYTELLYSVFDGRVRQSADLCNYWFLKAGDALAGTVAFGLVATKSIAKGTNNEILRRINSVEGVLIFEAWTNEPWVIDGAEVRVSIVCVTRSSNQASQVHLNGNAVQLINSNLTDGLDVASAAALSDNGGIAFQGVKLNGPFEIGADQARTMLSEPLNVNGLTNANVVRKFVQNDDVTERSGDTWIVDFTAFPEKKDAAMFQGPFEYLTEHVLPYRSALETSAASETGKLENYWLMQRPRPVLRSAIATLKRCILVPETSEHRIFVWSQTNAVFSGSIFVIAREDDCAFGVLCSRFHDAWATGQGNRLGAGNQRRYNATRTFETFPFPEGLAPNIPAKDYEKDPRAIAIARAAKRLDELRNAWLNPPDLVDIVPEVVPGYPDRILPKNEKAAVELKKRTLTNLYNARPQWLEDAHRDLDAAVAAAYGWPADISEEDALARLLELNLARAAAGDAAPDDEEEDDDEKPAGLFADAPAPKRKPRKK